jgi:hypothetical protein
MWKGLMLVLELEGPFMHGHRDDLPCSYLDLQKDGRSLDYNSYLDTKVLFPPHFVLFHVYRKCLAWSHV